jgi:hypothetical protein
MLVGTNSFAANPPGDNSCSSVADLDLHNATINGIMFVDGKACSSDAAESSRQCDWEHRIARDEILRPAAGKAVRLVMIHSNHKTGTGAWDTVLVFDCLNGLRRTIFEKKYLYGVRIRKTADGFVLTSGDWQPKDPICCPSKEKHETYRWNPNKNTYILESATTSTRKL